jgi:hypothetical protein
MEYHLFYSWQSDLENKTNRGFILTCIENAVKKIEKERNIKIFIDQATRDEKGAVHIAQTIENKIRQSDIFIGDISIINNKSKFRKTCNPNVIYELGLASEVVDWSSIICVLNTAHGDFSKLPFDIGYRKSISYSLNNNSSDKPNQKQTLTDKIYRELISIEFDTPKLRLKELVENLSDTEWEVFNHSGGQIDKSEVKGIVKIKHVYHNIFRFSFESHEGNNRFENGDWSARIFINQETLSTADIAYVSKVDFGFKKIILPDDRKYEHIYLIGVNYQNEGYGKQVFIKKEKTGGNSTYQ